jgi:hypothetical protein
MQQVVIFQEVRLTNGRILVEKVKILAQWFKVNDSWKKKERKKNSMTNIILCRFNSNVNALSL